MLITIFAYMKNRFPRHSARTVGSPTRSPSPTHPSPPTPTAQTTRYATWIWMGRKYVLQKECPQNSNSNSLQR